MRVAIFAGGRVTKLSPLEGFKKIDAVPQLGNEQLPYSIKGGGLGTQARQFFGKTHDSRESARSDRFYAHLSRKKIKKKLVR